MKKIIVLLLSVIVLTSCIPIRIAPNIKDHKVTKGKRFKKGLPKKTMFIFEDPKNEDEFYNYVNTKFQLQDYYVDVEVPFELENEKYYFSFYEVEIPTKTINLIPLFIDGVLSQTTDMDPFLEDAHASRIGNWYIAIEVFNNKEKDCLHEDSESRTKVLPYLGQLKKEYLNTVNYNEVVFKN
ncbi:hypothetical protein KIM67_02605 [Flagellimonas sp. 389]|uniref:hypothetical protein n=1 Tax=Flagellimonas sp. 389 TaxID=2835862 RepID=UPI001BD3012F|nr:hypothetical protein [Flagellimonas sp. 389]MBS9461287.1 hypothetical protein [Flagellimonas sp. 389]